MHIDQIIKKASKRMYFLIQLKRANVARHELILFYTSCIRSVMTYASPAFFYALPLYLKKDLENVEKRALSIICPGLAYRKALELSNIMSINDYIASLCKKTFLSIANDPNFSYPTMLLGLSPRLLRPTLMNEGSQRHSFFPSSLSHIQSHLQLDASD